MNLLRWMLPWEFSPTVLVSCVLTVTLFARGVRLEAAAGRSTWWLRQVGFYLGMVLVYVPLQTHLDYYAQHMFWIHRLQHMFLHHVGPFLIALSAPWHVIVAGLPVTSRTRLRSFWFGTPVRQIYQFLQQPFIAYLMFTGLIYFWLWPSIHFNAMLDATEYRWMNWSMVIDGLLFWWLMFDPRSREQGARMGFGARIPLVLLAMVPQLFLGAYLSLHSQVIYSVYAICGRLWPINPVTDQQLGGLIIWIPSSMMSVVASLIMIRQWMYNDARVRGAKANATSLQA